MALVICVGFGYGVLELLGVKNPAPGLAAAADRAVYHTGRIVTLLVFSPLWVPIWAVRFLATRVVAAVRAAGGRAEDREQAVRDRERAAAAQLAEAQQARRERECDDLRLSCDLFYSIHAPTIRDRFSKADFEEFVRDYMGDGEPADVVRRRAKQLMETIQLHVEAVEQPEEISSLEDLTSWYSQQKAKLESLEIDRAFKEEYLIQLNERFATLSQRILEVLKP